jgi:4-amino-4-deoxy-L-arabinose transferase-like glycosyltransferase
MKRISLATAHRRGAESADQRLFLFSFLLAFALRMVRVGARALWYDEAFAVLYASLSPAQMIYGTVTPAGGSGAADVHPLLYYFLLHGWMKLAGHSPLAARFLSVLLGVLTVALLTRLAVWCFDRRTGLVVGLLGALNPFHIAYSQEARMYALLGLATVTAAWGLLRALGERRGAERRSHGELFIAHCPLVIVRCIRRPHPLRS